MASMSTGFGELLLSKPLAFYQNTGFLECWLFRVFAFRRSTSMALRSIVFLYLQPFNTMQSLVIRVGAKESQKN
jgi:hypothetical protein